MLNTKSLSLTVKVAGLLASAALTSLVVAPKANAVLLNTSTDAFSGQLTDLGENSNPVLTINKYDAAAANAIVNSIEIIISGTYTTSGNILNQSGNTGSFITASNLLLFEIDPDTNAGVLGTTTFAPFGGFTGSNLQQFSEIFLNVPVGQTSFFNTTGVSGGAPFSVSQSTTLTFTDVDSINALLGNGTFVFTPTTLTSFGTTGIGGAANNVFVNTVQTFAGASVTVNYNGTINPSDPNPVPEPTTITGTLIALGFGAAMKKRFGAAMKKQAF